jgi:hypothetical protein
MAQKYYIAYWERPSPFGPSLERAMYEGDSKREVEQGAKRMCKRQGFKFVRVVRAKSPVIRKDL